MQFETALISMKALKNEKTDLLDVSAIFAARCLRWEW
jgi:hypothetical protein